MGQCVVYVGKCTLEFGRDKICLVLWGFELRDHRCLWERHEKDLERACVLAGCRNDRRRLRCAAGDWTPVTKLKLRIRLAGAAVSWMTRAAPVLVTLELVTLVIMRGQLRVLILLVPWCLRMVQAASVPDQADTVLPCSW